MPPARSAQEALAALGRARGHARRGARAGRLRRARAAAAMTARLAHAKINLALVVGPVGANGKHELTTVFQRVGLADRLELEPADALAVEGFEDDSLVRGALEALAGAAAVEPRGASGSRSRSRSPRVSAAEARTPPPRSCSRTRRSTSRSRAGSAARARRSPRRGRALLPRGRPSARRGRRLAAHAGGDPAGPHRRPGRSRTVRPRSRPRRSTAAFDERDGAAGYEERRAQPSWPRSPPATSPPCRRTTSPARRSPPGSSELGALRADVSGAGPAVYGLFADEAAAAEAVARCRPPWLGLDRARGVVGCARDVAQLARKCPLQLAAVQACPGDRRRRGDHRRVRQGLLAPGR